MTLTLTHDLGLGAVRLEPADPLAPPPKKKDRKNDPLTLLLAILFNALLIAIIFLRFPDMPPPRPAEPPSISVDLVQEPKPQEQAKPKPKEQPKPEETKPEEKRTYFESGGPENVAPGRAPQPEEKAEKKPPEPEAKIKKPEPPKQTIPDWARQLEPGFGIPRPREESKTASARPNTAKAIESTSMLLGEGGGDPYLNAMRDQIYANLTYPIPARGRVGSAVFVIVLNYPGTIKALRLVRSSGIPDLDFAAQEAILRSAPFPPLPNYFPNIVSITAPILVSPVSPAPAG